MRKALLSCRVGALLAALGLAFLCFGALGAEEPTAEEAAVEEETVEAVGLGVVVEDRVDQARMAAINDALRVAVEMRMGVRLESERISKDYILTKDRIRTQAKGAVHKYEIKQEERIGAVYRVVLNVSFRQDVFKARGLDRLQVAVISDEVTPRGALPFEVLTIQVNQHLIESGARVMPVPEKLQYGTSFEESVRAAKEASIDLVIKLRVRCEKKDEIAGLLLYRAEAHLQVVKPFTGQLLAEKLFAVDGSRQATQEAAAMSALVTAGKEVADYLASRVLQEQPLIERRLFVVGLDERAQVAALRKELLLRKGIVDVELKTFEEGNAVVLARMKLEAKDRLGEYLERIEGLQLKVVQESPGWVQLEALSEGGMAR